MSVYGLLSERLIKVIPVFSVSTDTGYGFSEERKPLLNTPHGFLPWGDLRHVASSQTNREIDGRWVFGNGNNTPRIAWLSLKTFITEEIFEIPNSAGNHSSPYLMPNSEYVVASTRFSVPMDGNTDVPISTCKENFRGTISFVKVDQQTGRMSLSIQIEKPGLNFDLAHAEQRKSDGWFFFSCYNSEQAPLPIGLGLFRQAANVA